MLKKTLFRICDDPPIYCWLMTIGRHTSCLCKLVTVRYDKSQNLSTEKRKCSCISLWPHGNRELKLQPTGHSSGFLDEWGWFVVWQMELHSWKEVFCSIINRLWEQQDRQQDNSLLGFIQYIKLSTIFINKYLTYIHSTCKWTFQVVDDSNNDFFLNKNKLICLPLSVHWHTDKHSLSIRITSSLSGNINSCMISVILDVTLTKSLDAAAMNPNLPLVLDKFTRIQGLLSQLLITLIYVRQSAFLAVSSPTLSMPKALKNLMETIAEGEKYSPQPIFHLMISTMIMTKINQLLYFIKCSIVLHQGRKLMRSYCLINIERHPTDSHDLSHADSSSSLVSEGDVVEIDLGKVVPRGEKAYS